MLQFEKPLQKRNISFKRIWVKTGLHIYIYINHLLATAQYAEKHCILYGIYRLNYLYIAGCYVSVVKLKCESCTVLSLS